MEGRTTFIIAHRLSTVQTADRLFVLDDGHVVQRGTHVKLMQEDGLYRRLASYQFRAPSAVER
jgi:subfamily B ATP-binding cassette protein MsbA